MIRPAFAALALSLSATAASAQVPTTAQPYLAAASAGNIFEITTSQIALMKTQNPAIRDFAMRMIADHTLAGNNALAAAKDANIIAPPAILDDQQRAQITQLLNAPAGQFDRLFWKMQVAAHEKSLNLHRTFAQGGNEAQLRTFAARIAPVVENHLEVARRQATR